MVDPKAHQLYKQIPGSGIAIDDASAGTGSASNGWELIQLDLNTAIAVYRTYIDLSGWSRESLTTFTQGVDIQKQQIPIKRPQIPVSVSAESLWEFDFITTRRLTDGELTNLFSLPGFAGSTVDLMQVIYGERMLYGENSTIPGNYIQISGETFGSGNPTAMNRMHWTRWIALDSPADDDQVAIWPTNLVVQAMSVEEKDLVWIERLRRSYVQQGEI